MGKVEETTMKTVHRQAAGSLERLLELALVANGDALQLQQQAALHSHYPLLVEEQREKLKEMELRVEDLHNTKKTLEYRTELQAKEISRAEDAKQELAHQLATHRSLEAQLDQVLQAFGAKGGNMRDRLCSAMGQVRENQKLRRQLAKVQARLDAHGRLEAQLDQVLQAFGAKGGNMRDRLCSAMGQVRENQKLRRQLAKVQARLDAHGRLRGLLYSHLHALGPNDLSDSARAGLYAALNSIAASPNTMAGKTPQHPGCRCLPPKRLANAVDYEIDLGPAWGCLKHGTLATATVQELRDAAWCYLAYTPPANATGADDQCSPAPHAWPWADSLWCPPTRVDEAQAGLVGAALLIYAAGKEQAPEGTPPPFTTADTKVVLDGAQPVVVGEAKQVPTNGIYTAGPVQAQVSRNGTPYFGIGNVPLPPGGQWAPGTASIYTAGPVQASYVQGQQQLPPAGRWRVLRSVPQNTGPHSTGGWLYTGLQAPSTAQFTLCMLLATPGLKLAPGAKVFVEVINEDQEACGYEVSIVKQGPGYLYRVAPLPLPGGAKASIGAQQILTDNPVETIQADLPGSWQPKQWAQASPQYSYSLKAPQLTPCSADGTVWRNNHGHQPTTHDVEEWLQRVQVEGKYPNGQRAYVLLVVHGGLAEQWFYRITRAQQQASGGDHYRVEYQGKGTPLKEYGQLVHACTRQPVGQALVWHSRYLAHGVAGAVAVLEDDGEVG